jgi:hypothetical protein
MDFTRSFGALAARRLSVPNLAEQEMEREIQNLVDTLEGRPTEDADSDGTAA